MQLKVKPYIFRTTHTMDSSHSSSDSRSSNDENPPWIFRDTTFAYLAILSANGFGIFWVTQALFIEDLMQLTGLAKLCEISAITNNFLIHIHIYVSFQNSVNSPEIDNSVWQQFGPFSIYRQSLFTFRDKSGSHGVYVRVCSDWKSSGTLVDCATYHILPQQYRSNDNFWPYLILVSISMQSIELVGRD